MKAVAVAQLPESAEQCDMLIGNAVIAVAIVMHRINENAHDEMLQKFVDAVKETYAKSEIIGEG